MVHHEVAGGHLVIECRSVFIVMRAWPRQKQMKIALILWKKLTKDANEGKLKLFLPPVVSEEACGSALNVWKKNPWETNEQVILILLSPVSPRIPSPPKVMSLVKLLNPFKE